VRRFALALLFACSSPSATIQVTYGGEPTDPDVSTATLAAVDQTGNSTTLGGPAAASGTLDLGDSSSTLVASLQLTGNDASGNAVVFGTTPFVELGALDGATLPLFVQRKGELARMPGETTDDRSAPLLAVTGRGIYYAGGSLSGASGPLDVGGYDLLGLEAFGTTCEVNLNATSFALIQLTQENENGDLGYAALVDDAGYLAVGLPSCGGGADTPTKELPTGLLSWADVSRAPTVMGDDGAAYIVGPSKTDAPSSSILVVSPKAESVSVISTTSRQGAASAWAPGRGIFLYGGGGGATLITAAGAATDSPYPVEPAQGLAAVAFDATKTMLVAGGAAAPVTIDLSCGAGCAPTPFGQAPAVALQSPSLFALGHGAFLLVGDDSSGSTHVFRLDGGPESPPEIPLKIPRQGARAVQTPTGAIVIVGGGSATPESYVE